MTDNSHSVPVAMPKAGSRMQQINMFLDKHVLPYPVRYLTNRITILATLCLLVPLILLATNQVFVLLANSYLNVMSVVVSSTVLLYSTISESRDRTATKRREEIAGMHQAMSDARAEADHKRILAIQQHIDEIHNELVQHISRSLDGIQKQLIEHLDRLELEEKHNTMIASVQAQRDELANLNRMVGGLRDDMGRPADDQK